MQRTVRRWSLAFVALASAAVCHAPARAGWSASLPTSAACTAPNSPELPTRWRAVGLMMPFLQGQIDVGEFVYDGTLRAMRATVYGLESGAVDLLVTENDTYRLNGPHVAPTHCSPLGFKLRMRSGRWLSDRAVCVGETHLGKKPVRWWKGPAASNQSKFHWFAKSTRLPWRSLFLTRSFDHAIVGDYAMTYFPTFAPLQETELSGLVDLCRAQAGETAAAATAASAPTARELMSVRNDAAEAERKDRIGTLIPGLGHKACSRMGRVHWPEQFVMTAVLTPIRFQDAPYSSLIYYDWRMHETQLALMFQGEKPDLKGLISLKKGVGYRLLRRPGGAICEAVFPGIVKPDWMSAAACECKGVIDGHPQLSPDGEAQILSYPIKWQGHRIMWNLYTASGRPMMFFEAAPTGAGLMLADYHDWLPGATAPASTYELPKICRPPDAATFGNNQEPTLSNPSCSDCHSTTR